MEVVGAFLKLGCISFGGPIAHLSYLHDEFVRRRRWIDDVAYANLVALCQFLPGPTSSQLVFALGLRRAGLAGAFLASASFTLPSAVLMMGFAYGISFVGDVSRAGWLHGLKLAAAAAVAQAVWAMGRKLCPHRPGVIIALVAAGALGVWPGVMSQVMVMAGGAMAGWMVFRDLIVSPSSSEVLTRRHAWAAGALVAFAVLLVTLPLVASASGSHLVAAFDRFYRSGALVFGGGHVVLPLLRAEVVAPGWISDDAFLAGYGAAQALPGPLFTFAAYLGTVMSTGPNAWLGGVFCLGAILLPSWLLVGGALPFWQLLAIRPWAQTAMRGANAAVVGILFSVLVHPILTTTLAGAQDVAVLTFAFVLLQIRRLPIWLTVILIALVGQWLS